MVDYSLPITGREMQLPAIHAHRFLAGLLGLTLLCPSAEPQSPNRELEVEVSDCWGGSLPATSKVTVMSLAPMALTEWYELGAARRFSLPPGRYALSVTAQGFVPYAAEIDMASQKKRVRTCLVVAPIEGRAFMIQVKGHISPTGTANNQASEVRLVGLYSDYTSSAATSTSGDFAFPNVQPGRYLVLMLAPSGVLGQREIDVKMGEPIHEIQW